MSRGTRVIPVQGQGSRAPVKPYLFPTKLGSDSLILRILMSNLSDPPDSVLLFEASSTWPPSCIYHDSSPVISNWKKGRSLRIDAAHPFVQSRPMYRCLGSLTVIVMSPASSTVS